MIWFRYSLGHKLLGVRGILLTLDPFTLPLRTCIVFHTALSHHYWKWQFCCFYLILSCSHREELVRVECPFLFFFFSLLARPVCLVKKKIIFIQSNRWLKGFCFLNISEFWPTTAKCLIVPFWTQSPDMSHTRKGSWLDLSQVWEMRLDVEKTLSSSSCH